MYGGPWPRRAVLLGLTALSAACEPAPKPGLFPSSAELYAEAHARFDPDGDGLITATEYQAFEPDPTAIGKLDGNKDGGVTAVEFAAFVHSRQPRALVSKRGVGEVPGPPRGGGPNGHFRQVNPAKGAPAPGGGPVPGGGPLPGGPPPGGPPPTGQLPAPGAPK